MRWRFANCLVVCDQTYVGPTSLDAVVTDVPHLAGYSSECMNYCLLTGATGLVGGFLLRYLLDADVSIAVPVRATRSESPAARIDAVMRRWEELSGCSLRRPVVLEGDLCKPFLGLDRDSRRWIANHCDRVVHNGASMTFRENQRTGEPFRTNVDGVRNLLDVCQDAGIRQFHHVSTAYICGLRTGRVLETELDLGQENGNVYEKSKMVGEKLVRGAEFLGPNHHLSSDKCCR